MDYGSSGKMGGKGQSTKGSGVKSGLSSQGGFHGESESSLGMDTKGPDQKPMATPNKSVSKGGKTFGIC